MGVNIFDNKPGTYKVYLDKKMFDRDINEINNLKQGDLNLKTMDRLVFLLERCAVSLRGTIEHYEKNEEIDYYTKENFKPRTSKKELTFDKNLPVKVEKKNEIIHIFTPYLFKRGMKESFFIANYLNGELKKEENKSILESISEGKKVVVVVRVSNKFNRTRHKDNDNLEVSEIINVMCENLRLSDSAIRMSFFSDFVLSNDKNKHGLHFFLIPYEEKDFRGDTWLKYFYE